MTKLTEITWCGRGGQGVVTAGKMLAETAMQAGRYFQSAPEYGPERAGAPIRAYTRLSDEPISLHSSIEEPDIVVILDPTVIGPVDVTAGLKPEGMIIVNTAKSPEEMGKQLFRTSGRVVTIDATRIALEEIGRDITNTPLLGAIAAVTGIFAIDEIMKQARLRFGKKFLPSIVEANVRAIRRGASEVRQWQAQALSNEHAQPRLNRQGLNWQSLPLGGLILEAGNALAYHTGGWRSFRPVIHWEKTTTSTACSKCLTCWLYCPDSSMIVVEGDFRGVNLNHCKGCGICAQVCPSGSITMVEESLFAHHDWDDHLVEVE